MKYAIAAAVLFLFIVFGFLLFSGGSEPKAPVDAKTLPDLASTQADMRLTIQGQINGEESHRQIVMTVGKDQRTLQIVGGYQGNVIKSESLGNNQSAYNAFLHALNVAGYTKINKSRVDTEQGQCPLGQRYIYEIINNGEDDSRTWSTNCNNDRTYGGQPSLTRDIFRNQFANYSEFTSDVQL